MWENAPDQQLEFDVSAPGYVRLNDFRIRPDDEEHTVTLSPALVISGTVRDAVSRDPIPKFRIGIGWPEQGPDGTMQPRWSDIDRFWLKFSNGEFRHALEEMVIGGSVNRGYVFRFEAEGHKPFVSRVYQPEEGEVRLEVELPPARDVRAIVYRPDGKPAPHAQIGLVAPGNEIELVPGGFAGDLGNAMAWLRRADSDGWFIVPDDDQISRVIVASPEGFGDAAKDGLRELPTVQLVPWSRIGGVVRTDGHPIEDAEVLVLWSSPAMELNFRAPSVPTDAEGRFTFPQVPPGSFQIYLRTSGEDWGDAKARIDVAAGETKQVVLEDAVAQLR